MELAQAHPEQSGRFRGAHQQGFDERRRAALVAVNAAGQCGNSDGTTQVGWNIKWVNVAGGARRDILF